MLAIATHRPTRRPKAFCSRLTAAALLAGTLFLSPAATTGASAQDDWQLSHGVFVTGADVRNHNQLPGDRRDILTVLGAEPRDWSEALHIYSFGQNFPWRDKTHSLGRFADNYNNAMPSVLPASIEHFGSATFQNAYLFSAIAGTNQFQNLSETARIAAVEEGSLAVILNWCRFELALSERKALAATPNWSIQNGSPKNWNEIFAFYFGPEGAHSVHAALAEIPGGADANEELFQVLADGQVDVLAERWPAADGAKIASILDRASILLMQNAIAGVDDASDDELPVIQARAAGAWLAAAEAIVPRDADLARSISAALTGTPDRIEMSLAADALSELSF